SPERIPPAGALAMMYDDPYLQGPRLFKQNCAGRHNHDGAYSDAANEEHNRRGNLNEMRIGNEAPTATTLWDVGGKYWIESFLVPKRIADHDHLGYPKSPFVDGDMVNFVKESFGDDVETKPEEVKSAIARADIILALMAEADKPAYRNVV